MSPQAVQDILQDFANRAQRVGAIGPDGSETWRFDVDASGFDAGAVDRLDSDVRQLDASFGESTFGQRLGTDERTPEEVVAAIVAELNQELEKTQ